MKGIGSSMTSPTRCPAKSSDGRPRTSLDASVTPTKRPSGEISNSMSGNSRLTAPIQSSSWPICFRRASAQRSASSVAPPARTRPGAAASGAMAQLPRKALTPPTRSSTRDAPSAPGREMRGRCGRLRAMVGFRSRVHGRKRPDMGSPVHYRQGGPTNSGAGWPVRAPGVRCALDLPAGRADSSRGGGAGDGAG